MENKLENKITNIINDNHLYGVRDWEIEDSEIDGIKIIEMTVTGDWKHDHARTKYIMAQNSFAILSQTTTESDGSDYYTAIHRYIANV